MAGGVLIGVRSALPAITVLDNRSSGTEARRLLPADLDPATPVHVG